jgi:hypothetical protein
VIFLRSSKKIKREIILIRLYVYLQQTFYPVFTMHPRIALLLALFSQTLAQPSKRAPQGSLYIADYGVGHRSTPIPRWRTSLRKLNIDGTNSTILQEFGPANDLEVPIGVYAFSYDPRARQFYIATASGRSIIRTDLDGSNPTTILTESDPRGWISSLTVQGQKLWYGTGHYGLLKRANLDGSGLETFLNVSQGVNFEFGPNYTPAYSYANGIAVDEANNLVYWSSYKGSIRRAPLIANTTNIEILVEDIWEPGQLRLVRNSTLYWTESGNYIRRAYIPPNQGLEVGTVQPETLLNSSTTNLLSDSISSFAVSEEDEMIWVATQTAASVTSGRLLEMDMDGDRLKSLNENVTQIGVPIGLEYVM